MLTGSYGALFQADCHPDPVTFQRLGRCGHPRTLKLNYAQLPLPQRVKTGTNPRKLADNLK